MLGRHLVTLASTSGKRNAPSVCLLSHLFSNVRHSFLTLIRRGAHTQRDSPGPACDAASVHFGQKVRRIDIHVSNRHRISLQLTPSGLRDTVKVNDILSKFTTHYHRVYATIK